MSTKPRRTLPVFTPVPRKCRRHDGWTPERQQLFIEALADYGSVRAAANSVGMTPESAYHLRRHPDAATFRKAWEAALDLGVQRIEDVAMDRALNGIEVPVYSYGKLVGTRTIYNDRLLMFMLRNRAPKRFAEGGARGLSAMDKQALARLKREWRKDWEQEQRLLGEKEEADALDSLAAKFDRAHEAHLQAMSPRTRAAWDTYQRLQAEDAATGYQWWNDPEHPDYALPQDGADAEDAEWEALPRGPSEEMKKVLEKRHREPPPDDGWEMVDYEEEYGGGTHTDD
ncbi:hypothetical protein [Aurantiacibacter gilvus]|uniref:Terminase n=1 Tax=Aurantiacibacter gilvus TaxID=3139141 RepID=A0ABU9IDK3_9SPHN